MNRTQTILAGILGLQVVLIFAFRSPLGGEAHAVQARPLLPALAAVSPAKLQLLGEEGRQITLTKTQDRWSIDEQGGFPADGKKVAGLLEKLAGIQVKTPIASSSRHHDDFKVTDDGFLGRIKVWADPASDPQVDLIVGESPNFRTSYARLEGDDAVFEVRDLASYEVRADPAAWIEKELIAAQPEQITGLRLTNDQGSFELAREEGGPWKVVEPASAAGTAIDAAQVDTLLRAVTSIRLADAAGAVDDARHGFATPAAQVVLRWKDAGADEAAPREATLVVGGRVADQETQRFVTRSGSGFAGTVWDSGLAPLIEKKLSDLAPA